jgi:hypothetical protein
MLAGGMAPCSMTAKSNGAQFQAWQRVLGDAGKTRCSACGALSCASASIMLPPPGACAIGAATVSKSPINRVVCAAPLRPRQRSAIKIASRLIGDLAGTLWLLVCGAW